MNALPIPYCIGCGKPGEKMYEYICIAEEEKMTPNEYIRKEEGTYNPDNGHFLCTPCYVNAGQPSRRGGWKAP